ncbi:GNAT family N-acetyltransferase [Stackebrandtia nassauensis]|uniref:GCN5-related N-acetyltransferase n=1 Tax=Stackebrandtia nassauensis (strain DSM 44728 / CIP 108903 / NRRL B-16338 / NBRC 102104 / LLR-40K-21) TaxID=446470 RepID=D3Q255_STANL|nr:GNAT family N-acetyltransferase [Stackebrandtia nassauensis]ADD41922.1 GCN5-related N-acetyltransferase [Stackebrandtia nassauensis DSM 44728]
MALGYVRPARESDAEEIARIQSTTWRTAYDKIVPSQVLAGMDEAWLAEQWRQACVAPPSPAHRVFVAIEQVESDASVKRVVGFAAVGPGEDDEAGAGAVTELLVEPRFARRGHGSRLLSAMVEQLREHDLTTVYAWVFPRDAAALNFYKSAGWAPEGTRRTLDMDGTEVPQLRLHVDLTEAPGPVSEMS